MTARNHSGASGGSREFSLRAESVCRKAWNDRPLLTKARHCFRRHCLVVGCVLATLMLSRADASAQERPGAAVQESQSGAPASAGVPAGETLTSSPNYVIGPNDRLKITIWNQENISGDYVVSADGSFTFPLIGRVVAAGLTLSKFETEMKRLLGAGYFNNPQVTVAVAEFRSKRVHVTGAVRQPGTFPVTGEMNLIEALARAGTTTPDAADHVLIIRSAGAEGPLLPGQDPSASVTRIDLRELDSGQLPSLKLLGGETIHVPRRFMVYVSGQVRTPGSYPIREGMTVRQALSMAGGTSEFGATNRIKILRKEDGKLREVKVEMEDLVRPDDTIVVPERRF
jgi:polysaccharide biosynthesis/export protein